METFASIARPRPVMFALGAGFDLKANRLVLLGGGFAFAAKCRRKDEALQGIYGTHFFLSPVARHLSRRISLAELKISVIVNTLRSCQLFTGLPPEDQAHIAEVTVVKSLEMEEYLFHEGDPAHGFYVVQRGAVKVHRVAAAGNFRPQRRPVRRRPRDVPTATATDQIGRSNSLLRRRRNREGGGNQEFSLALAGRNRKILA
jgi:hypothetical protein